MPSVRGSEPPARSTAFGVAGNELDRSSRAPVAGALKRVPHGLQVLDRSVADPVLDRQAERLNRAPPGRWRVGTASAAVRPPLERPTHRR